MSYVFNCIFHHHDATILLLAILVCIVSALSVFAQLRRSFECVADRRLPWRISAAVTGGVGVWSTHFISMIGFHSPVELRFELELTALSAMVAIGCFAIAFSQLRWPPRLSGILLCGGVTVVGINGMHLTGMAAIAEPVVVETAYIPIAGATLFGWLILSLSFACWYSSRGWVRRVVPAIGMVAATATIHFVAMASVTIRSATPAMPGMAHGHPWLLESVAAVTFLLIGLTAAAAVIDRFLTDLRGLSNATSEGLLISCDGIIREANEPACALLGVDRSRLIGTDPALWFEAPSGTELSFRPGERICVAIRDSMVEDQRIELTSREIEYHARAATVIVLHDLTESARAQRAIDHMASHDPLTGLANRAAFDLALREAVRSGAPFGLVVIDLDRFKAVNDLFGHAAGDSILTRVAHILHQSATSRDLVARVGGDEFFVLQRDIGSTDDTRRLTGRILAHFATEMDSVRDPMAVGCSLGVVTFPQDGHDPQTLRHNADVALSRAKQDERGSASFFDATIDREARERRSLEHDLRHAICRNQLQLVYQPLVSTHDSATVGYEALLRWHHPERGQISPALFIPVAEETGTILAIGEWVLYRACQEASTWGSHLTLAVNVSPVQLRVATLPDLVRGALNDSGLDPKRLELEITETALLRDREISLDVLRDIRALGVRIAMDDFGTGYSSLSNLRTFPFDKIKIDRSFVSAMHEDEAARSIVRAIAGLGKGLNLPVVAEGVENEMQRVMVRDEGCSLAQGFLFGRPGAVTDARPAPHREARPA